MDLKRLNYLLMIALLVGVGCAPTKPKAKPLPPAIYPAIVYPISHYPFSTNVDGLEIAAIPYVPGKNVFANPSDTTSGVTDTVLNIIDAGVQPIRLIIWNKSSDIIVIDPSQIFGLSNSANYFPYPPEDAVNLVVKSDIFREAVESNKVGPMIESLLGSAELLSTAIMGVPGLTIGSAFSAYNEPADTYVKQLTKLITKIFNETALVSYTLYPEYLVHGLVYLPSHSQIETLRIIGIIPKQQISTLVEIDFGDSLP